MHPRDRILHAAAQLYAETGFRGATTRRIAQLAGVNEITLFRHFGSKTRLLHEAIRCAGASGDLCGLPERAENPRKELKEWAWSSYRELHARRSLIRTAMGEMGEHPDMMPAENSATVRAVRALAQYLDRLRSSGISRVQLGDEEYEALPRALAAPSEGIPLSSGPVALILRSRTKCVIH